MHTITQTSGFSSDRFLQLCKRFWAVNQKMWTIGFSGALGLLIVIWLGINLIGAPGHNAALAVIPIGLLLYQLGGYALTSTIFSELNSVGSASQMFTLPASSFEKLFSAWFLTYFCFTILSAVTLTILSYIMGTGSSIFFESGMQQTPELSQPDLAGSILTYTIYQSIFLLGAVYFNNNNFLKTVLAMILFFAILGISSILFLNFYTDAESFHISTESLGFLSEGYHWLRILTTVVITGFFISLAYIRLKNRQVA